MNSDTMPMLDVEVGQLQASNESIIIREGASIGWLTKYSILLVRNYKNYIRNLGNVVARLVITVVAAVVCGMVYRNMGAREKTPQLLISILGAIFVGLFTMNLLPFASFSSFLYDRQFFQGENAAGIYPVSAYYAANVTLEVLFNSINAACFATITYVMIDFHTFIEATSYAPALGYVGIITLSSLVANVSQAAIILHHLVVLSSRSMFSGQTQQIGLLLPFILHSLYRSGWCTQRSRR